MNAFLNSFLLRFDPALFEMFFPVLRPRAAEIIDEARLAGNQLGRLAVGPVDDRALHPALDEVEPPVRIVEPRPELPRRDRAPRTGERVRGVEGRIHRGRPSVRPRLEHLDRCDVPAEL